MSRLTAVDTEIRPETASKTIPAPRRLGGALSSICAALAALVLGLGQARAQSTQNYTTAGNATWTVPAGVTSVQVEAWGGGGGSGGAGANFASTGGGSGGSFVEYTVAVTPGSTYNLTVGSGGTAGTGGASGTGTSGGTGGASYFGNTTAGSSTGALVLAVGGTGSVGNNSAGTSTTNRTATNGATAPSTGNFPSSGTGLVSYYGTNGANAVTNSNNSGAGGAGAGPTGRSGGGAGGAALTSAGNGKAGTAPGGGGGGADQSSSASNGTGAAGGVGEVLLTFTSPSSITVSGALSAYSSIYGTASASQSLSVSGSSLSANIVVSPPTGFEISTSAGSGYGSSVTLTESGGTVAATTVYVRVAAATIPGSYSGNVSFTSTGAATQNAAIPSSTVSPLALTVSGAAVTSKDYDGTTTAVITGTLVGVISPDVVNLVGTGTFAQATSGTAIAVTSTSTLSGANAGNYTLVQPTGLTGTIVPTNNLGGFSMSSGTPTPAFLAGVTGYTSGVGNNVTSITVTPVVDSSATVTVNGAPVASGSASSPISLSVGANTITVSVTDGGNTQSYTFVVTRAAPFTQGNLVVQQADDGSVQNTTITLLEINSAATSTQADPVQSIQLPGTNTSGAVPQALRINGSGGTTGYLATSADETFLVVAAADATNASDLGQTTAADIDNREILTLDGSANEVYQASYTGNGGVPATGNQCRAATSLDNTTWFVADKGGIYTTSAASPATAPDSTTNMLVTKSFGGVVYGFSASAPGVSQVVSSGASIGTLTSLPGLSIASYTDFYLISSGVNGATFDVCYVAVGSSATSGTINKYSLVSGSWVANGTYTTTFGGRSMVAAGNGAGANLYLTGGNGSTSGMSVMKVTDTAGYNQTINVVTANNVALYTFAGGASGPVPKGIAFAPLSAALPDLTVAVASPLTVASGSNFNYTLTVANSGAASASGVAVQLTLPAGLSYVSAADTGGAGFSAANSGGVVTFTGGALAANASETLTVTVNGADSTYVVDAGPTPATGHGFAVVNPSGSIAESNTANNSSNVSAVSHVGTAPYLGISVTGSSSAVADSTGSPITYTIVAQNMGNATGTGVSVQFTLPAGLSLISAIDTGSAGFTSSSSGNAVTFSGGTLAANASETLTVTAEASTSTYRIYSVDLPAGAAVISASNTTGTSSSTGSVVTYVTLPSGADLVVSSTPSGPFLAGDSADAFTLYVTNDGTGATSGTVTLTDTLPAGLTPAASMNGATINGWTVAVGGQTVTATRSDTLNPGVTYPATASGLNYYPALNVLFSVASNASGSVSNTVAVSGGGDAFTENDSITNTVTIGTPTPISSAGYLLVSRGHYLGANITAGSTILPNGSVAAVSGAYPYVWGNESPDVSFGVTAPIYLDLVNKTTGAVVNSTNVTALIATQLGLNVTTSFSSKSEVGLNVTPDGTGVTFSGYMAPAETLDASNANTLYHDDPTNLIAANGDFQKAIVQINYQGNAQVTPNNAYSGDNCRAVVLANAADGNAYYYSAGSAGNSGSGVTGTTMTMLAQSTGIQMVLPGAGGQTTAVGEPYGTANATTGYQLGYDGLSTDKTGKDMNLRGLTLNPYNNTLYTSKGSGGSGVDTVYQVGSGAVPTPTSAPSVAYTIPSGFPTASGSGLYPFGMWFANAYTMYVADEGLPSVPGPSNFSGGVYTQAIPANNPNAGLQKWVNSQPDGSGTWTMQYVLNNGLNLGVPYAYTIANYPTGTNSATGVPWQPANNGLRNITGQINGDGTVTIYAVTSTISGETDEGADPNQLVSITDSVSATSLPVGESFTVLQEATGLDVIRGVALSTPYTPNLAATFGTAAAVPVTADGYTATGISLDSLTLGFAPTAGQVLTLVNNTGSSPISGTFTGLAQGATVNGTFSGTTYHFTISYTGGDGNDITLTANAPAVTSRIEPSANTQHRLPISPANKP